MSSVAEILSRLTSASELNNLLEKDKFKIISVRTFKALGDGVTNDTVAIEAAKAAAVVAGNLALYFPHGTYLVDADLDLAGYFLWGDDASFSGISDVINQVGNWMNATAGSIITALLADKAVTVRKLGFDDYLTCGTNSDTKVITPGFGLTSYPAGLTLKMMFSYANTGATTLNMDSLGAKSVVNQENGHFYNVAANDIIPGYVYQIMYCSSDVWVILNPVSKYLLNSVISSIQNSAYIYAASSAGTDTYAVTLAPVPTAYVAGMIVNMKADVGNTGAATVNVNTLGAKDIKKVTNAGIVDIATGNMMADGVYSLMYAIKGAATYFILLNPTLAFADVGLGTEYQGLRMKSDASSPEWGNVMIGEIQSFGAGTTAFVAPKTGKYRATVVGGGGGGGNGGSKNASGGGGGMAVGWTSLTKGTSYNAVVGAGGAVGSVGGYGSAGGTSSFNGIQASGGTGGQALNTNNTAYGGSGGGASGGSINEYGSDGTAHYWGTNDIPVIPGYSPLGHTAGRGGPAAYNGSDGIVIIEW